MSEIRMYVEFVRELHSSEVPSSSDSRSPLTRGLDPNAPSLSRTGLSFHPAQLLQFPLLLFRLYGLRLESNQSSTEIFFGHRTTLDPLAYDGSYSTRPKIAIGKGSAESWIVTLANRKGFESFPHQAEKTSLNYAEAMRVRMQRVKRSFELSRLCPAYPPIGYTYLGKFIPTFDTRDNIFSPFVSSNAYSWRTPYTIAYMTSHRTSQISSQTYATIVYPGHGAESAVERYVERAHSTPGNGWSTCLSTGSNRSSWVHQNRGRQPSNGPEAELPYGRIIDVTVYVLFLVFMSNGNHNLPQPPAMHMTGDYHLSKSDLEENETRYGFEHEDGHEEPHVLIAYLALGTAPSRFNLASSYLLVQYVPMPVHNSFGFEFAQFVGAH
ncbi:hypothetical protein FB446DRAFT_800620 [Lentinula raphanica]|nr:hypothetical protein FB446DRAFT_800620 [Lentinula raphanica]